MATYKEREIALLQEELLKVRSLLKSHNIEINYFGKIAQECYMEVLLIASLKCLTKDVRGYKSLEFSDAMVEEVTDNVIAFMSQTSLKTHSELTYFLNELKRVNDLKEKKEKELLEVVQLKEFTLAELQELYDKIYKAARQYTTDAWQIVEFLEDFFNEFNGVEVAKKEIQILQKKVYCEMRQYTTNTEDVDNILESFLNNSLIQ